MRENLADFKRKIKIQKFVPGRDLQSVHLKDSGTNPVLNLHLAVLFQRESLFIARERVNSLQDQHDHALGPSSKFVAIDH